MEMRNAEKQPNLDVPLFLYQSHHRVLPCSIVESQTHLFDTAQDILADNTLHLIISSKRPCELRIFIFSMTIYHERQK